jgi:hypothetical protein
MFMQKLLNIVSYSKLSFDKIIPFMNIDNHLIDNYSIILLRCTDQEREILSLRQENIDLKINPPKYE